MAEIIGGKAMIKMRKSILSTFLVGLLLVASPVSATNYQDWWWDPTKNGQGVNIGHQGGTLGAAWFLYDQTGLDMWVIMAGPLVGNTVTSNLTRYTGPPLGTPFNPAQVVGTVVGQATLTFTGPNSAVLSYTVHGVPGTLSLTRFTLGPLPIAGQYLGGGVGSSSGCLNPSNNGSFAYGAAYVVASTGTTITFQEQFASGGACSGLGQYAQSGSKITAQGSLFCTTGVGGTWSSSDITVTEDAFIAQVSLQYTVGETCHSAGKFGGLRIN
jgi:hypothetical protein